MIAPLHSAGEGGYWGREGAPSLEYSKQEVTMRFGGPVFETVSDPEAWVQALRRLGYTAAYCPVGPEASDQEVREYEWAAAGAGIVIAEVGAWSNLLSPDAATRTQALEHCRRQLDLADRIGARCCVNIAGSRGPLWHGPHRDDLADDAFDLVVESVRSIIDTVRPTRTYYALETMQWMLPDSLASYERLLRAVDRTAFAVHFDPVNLVNSPERYYHNGPLIREFVSRLGPHIRSCHAKDVLLAERALVHLDEVRPGLGGLDYATYLRELSRLEPETPLMLEHLQTAEEYALAAKHIRGIGKQVGVEM